MKTTYKISLFLLISFIMSGCDKDDELINSAPNKVTITATPSGNTALLNWTAAVDPEGSTVKYSVMLEQETVLSNSTATQYNFTGLDYETAYSGKVIASDPEGMTSETRFNFTTGDTPNTAPSIVVLITPADGANHVVLVPELSWNAATDPDGDTITYALYLDKNSSPSTSIATAISDVSYTVTTSLDLSTTYYWKVIASDGKGGTSESAIASFTIKDNEAPLGFNLTEVANTATGVALSPTFSWEASIDPDGGAISYDLYLDTNSNPINKIAENLSATSYQTSVALAGNTKYYWKVIAKDPQGTETSSATWSFTTRDLVTSVQATTNAPWIERAYHTSLVFDNKMWIIGGGPNNNGAYKDVWYSTDGVNWTQATDDAAFGGRKIHASVVFDNKMWVIGGIRFSHSAGNELSDVWYSTDGIDWTLATDNAFPGRLEHEAVVFDGKMWVIGGRDYLNNVGYAEIWSSSDGVDWTMDTSGVNLGSTTAYFTVNEFNGKLWKLGGNDQRIYSSSDGINWVLESDTCPMGNRLGHSMVVFDNKLWLISGVDHLISVYNEIADVWFTEDGINWELASANAGFHASWAHSSVVYDDKMWIIGGGGGFGSFSTWNEVWYLHY